ncbi:MAG: hypothetical protein KDA71_23870 [Planctomycetales bacterium]|nr:hypothetical protein [Planctomycetales bacterium]
MSSPTCRAKLDGLIIRGDRIIGSVALPSDPDAFIAQFNRRYEAVGMRVTPRENLEMYPSCHDELGGEPSK